MKRTLSVFFLLLILLTACTDPYKKITAEDAKKLIDTEDVIVLDVRTESEYLEGHIKDALLLPETEIKYRAEKTLPDKNKKILIYCRSGRRSELAARDLIELGYKEVYDFGGIIDWPYNLEK
ncbi:MAG: rhodanese-like domain-containing protein [Peptococcaceae bacterium]|nr:rhodanese-like domain-containing protein [Peptococcaceae bacterium]